MNWTTLALGLAGGLALFLIGMDQMSQSLKALAGFRLQKILAKLSSNRFAGAATGAVTTAALQSSSLTTVLTVGFVSAELFTLTQAASVIIGANLGTTVTAQIIALDIAEYSLGLLAVGAAFWLFATSRRYRQMGRALAAIGFVFFGLQIMSDAMQPLTSYQPLLETLRDATNPLLAVVAGAVVAALIQSSSATAGIVIVMSANGLVDLKSGIAIILGANIGTCVTALFAAIGKDRNSLRAALVHVVVNVSGVLLWLFLLTPLTEIVQLLSDDTLGLASPRQLANAHTLFNVINTIIFLALLTPVVKFTKLLVPHKAQNEKRTSYLDKSIIETPTLGIVASQKQNQQLAFDVAAYFNWGFLLATLSPLVIDEKNIVKEIENRKNKIREDHRKIVSYLADLSHSSKDDRQSQQILNQLTQANEIIHLADYLSSSFRKIIRRRLRSNAAIKPVDKVLIENLQKKATSNLSLIYQKTELTRLTKNIELERENIAARFTKNKSEKKLDEFILESDLLDAIDRVSLVAMRLNENRLDINPND